MKKKNYFSKMKGVGRTCLLMVALASSILLNAQCYTPLYSSGNLVTDPECNTANVYKSWGAYTQVTGSTAYCGTSVRVTGSCGGSLDYSLTGKLSANTVYRLKAMIFSNGNATLTLNGCGIGGTTADYLKTVNTGSAWQAVDFLFTTGTLGSAQNFWLNSCSGAGRATDIRLDNFEIYAYVDPILSVSTSSILFDGTTSGSFTVTGTSLVSPITLTAPTGISLSTYSISGNPTAQSVTVTYDGITSVDDTIRLTSGTAKAKIAVKSYHCYAPTYSSGNMIADPTFGAATLAAGGFGGWGPTSIISTNAYCGGSAYVRGSCYPNGGSIDRALTTANGNALKPLTKYRLRAMVKSKASAGKNFQFQIEGVDGTSSVFFLLPNTNGWKQIDTTFTTGATVSEHGIYFNSCTATTPAITDTCFIDNYELYAIPTWNGTGSWSTSANWGGTVPTAGADIYVMSGELDINQNLSLANVTVAPGAKLTLSSGNSLTMSGNLTINSDATGTGTFVDLNPTGGLTVNGTIGVHQHLLSGRNWYVSSPVTGATVSAINTSTGSSIVSYDEMLGSTSPWITESSTLAAGKGYVVVSPVNVDPTITFSGTLNTGTQTINLARTAGQTKEGFNLIGNPYPSYVNWQSAVRTNVGPTMWYRSKNYGGSVYTFATFGAVSGLGTGLKTALDSVPVTNLIPPMQGFWVRVDAGQTTGSVVFENAMRSHAGATSTMLKAPAKLNATQQVLRLQVSNGVNSDEAIVLFNANATNGLDDYDSPKMTNANAAVPEIYTTIGNEQMVINGLNSIPASAELPLGFTTGQSNTFSIKATEFSNFDAGMKVNLKDMVLGTEQELTDGSTYNFTSDVTSTNTRFSVVFKSTGVTTGLNNISNDEVALIYKNVNNNITVDCKGDISSNAVVSVYNAVGQKLLTNQIVSTSTVIGAGLKSGVYVVTVNNGGRSTTQKVILN